MSVEASSAAPAATAPDRDRVEDGPVQRNELATQWRALWSRLKIILFALAALAALILAGQVFLFYELFARLHWAAGAAFVILLAAFIARYIVWPALAFFRTPMAAAPPNVDLGDEKISRADLRERARFDETVLSRLKRHPDLGTERPAIEAALAALREIEAAIPSSPPPARAAALRALERERIAPLFAPIDRMVDDYIRKEALSVGAATSISMNGSVDAFIVLWRNVNMVSRVARAYSGRPDLRYSLVIMKDIAVAVVFSRFFEDISETAGDLLGGVLTRVGGMVAGPLLDGSANTLLTLKIGYLAKRRCRSFDVWSRSNAEHAARDVFAQVRKESAGMIGELIKRCGGAAGGVANLAGDWTDRAVGGAVDGARRLAGAPAKAWARLASAKNAGPTAGD